MNCFLKKNNEQKHLTENFFQGRGKTVKVLAHIELMFQWDKIKKKKSQEIENKAYEKSKIQVIVYFRISV